jgi:uncharacterized protein (TIGR03083 family)
MAMSTVEERIEILKAESQRLEHYLHTLSPEDWHHPSTCDQWTVADVIAHLTVGSRSHATWITEALSAESVTALVIVSFTPVRSLGDCVGLAYALRY